MAFPQKANFTVPMEEGRKFTFCAAASTGDVYKVTNIICGNAERRAAVRQAKPRAAVSLVARRLAYLPLLQPRRAPSWDVKSARRGWCGSEYPH